VALCDEAGVTIGFFPPATRAPNLEPRIRDEEMDRRLREEPLFSTEEILAHLRTL
jgi:hypothetical protein